MQIKRNIDNFLGNPNDITIFGESSGSWSVSYHILSPLSKNLFKKAIVQSGTAFTVNSFMTKEEALNNSKKFSQDLGCNQSDQWINCLKQLNASLLTNYSIQPFQYGLFGFLPVVGEAFYPVNSFEAVKTGKFNSEIDLLAGVS